MSIITDRDDERTLQSEGYKKLIKMAKEGDVGARQLCDGMVELMEHADIPNTRRLYYYNDYT